MATLQISEAPVARTAMLVRRAPDLVFEAFVDPEQITQFWFTRSSGRLEAGATVEWTWEMYGFSIPVRVVRLEPPRPVGRIEVEWPGESGPTLVEWSFEPHGNDATFVRVENRGFAGDGDALVKQALDSVSGFSLVLAGAKAYLEHGIRLNLVADRFPKGLEGP